MEEAAGSRIRVAPDPKKVYVVHGRNRLARDAIRDLLKKLGLKPIFFENAVHWCSRRNPHPRDVISAAFKRVQAVVVLMSGDDVACLLPCYRKPDDPPSESDPTPQVRPNVLFEAGFAYGKHPGRTILVQVGVTRGLTDLQGLHVPRVSDPNFCGDLAARLLAAKCKISKKKGWDSAGNFGGAALMPRDLFQNTQQRKALAMLEGIWTHEYWHSDGSAVEAVETATITSDGRYIVSTPNGEDHRFDLCLLEFDEHLGALSLAKRRRDGSLHCLEALVVSADRKSMWGHDNNGTKKTYSKRDALGE